MSHVVLFVKILKFKDVHKFSLMLRTRFKTLSNHVVKITGESLYWTSLFVCYQKFSYPNLAIQVAEYNFLFSSHNIKK